jgi:hypothetical protein
MLSFRNLEKENPFADPICVSRYAGRYRNLLISARYQFIPLQKRLRNSAGYHLRCSPPTGGSLLSGSGGRREGKARREVNDKTPITRKAPKARSAENDRETAEPLSMKPNRGNLKQGALLAGFEL